MADRPQSADASYVGRNFSSAVSAVPARLAIALYLSLTAILLVLSLARTGGTFVYVQDDPYIHLAMARTLAEHGVWGVRPYEFASASSSPLWTLLLAGFWKASATAVWVPFALNIAAGCALLGLVARILARRSGLTARWQLAVLAAIVLVTPLPTLAFIGMEHTLQILLVVAFADMAASRLAGERDDWLWPAVVAAAMAATRYESLFLVAVVGALLARKGRLRPAVLVGASAAAPVIAFAFYSVAHGGLVLPNSVLMKSVPGRFATVGSGLSAVAADWVAILNLYKRPPQLVLTLAVLSALLLVPVARLSSAGYARFLAVIFVWTSVIHACLVKLEWFFRYEAYLMTLGLLSSAGLAGLVEWPRGAPKRRSVLLHPAVVPLLVLLSLPLAARSLTALATTARAAGNVYEQQVQLGRFFERHYAGRPIAVNDLGAVAWLSSSRILDIVGLASQPVADLKRQKALNAAALEQLAATDRVEAVAVYEDVFAPILPERWVKVGEWTIADNVAVSGDVVSFFALDARSASTLREALDAYADELPSGVEWQPRTDREIPRPSR